MVVVGCLVWNASEVLMGVATGGVPVRLRFLVLETGLNIRDVLGEERRSIGVRKSGCAAMTCLVSWRCGQERGAPTADSLLQRWG